jgi:hypothetical protein
MGLDSYAVKMENMSDEKFKGIGTLCGGMFSQGDDGEGSTGNSFRGKVYNDFVEKVTGYSLYEELDNYTCGKIADCIKKFLKGNPDDKEWDYGKAFTVTREEATTLAKWFKIVHDNDGSYHAWY